MEIWKDIPSYEGLYKASNSGRIKSLTRLDTIGRRVNGRVMSQFKDSHGYNQVRLSINGSSKMFLVHRLIAYTFLDYNISEFKMIVDHINNNPTDNNIENLQIISRRDNCSKDQFRHNRYSKYVGVTWNKRDNKWKSQIRINKKMKYLGQFNNEYKAHLAYQEALNKLNI